MAVGSVGEPLKVLTVNATGWHQGDASAPSSARARQ
jgi:hypothetical protein